MDALTLDMILVMVMIGLAVFLFIVEWVRVDVVAILMTVALPLLGLQGGFCGVQQQRRYLHHRGDHYRRGLGPHRHDQ